jgi:predicted ArsR family transcriptional regulator
VSELAAILDLTANGVRGHLAALEADGLVKRTGVRRGVGKPAHVFQLTPGGHSLLSSAYRPVLHALLDVLGDGMRERELPDLLRQAGRRLAARHPKVTGDLRGRAEAGATVLRELGSVAKVEEDGAIFIRGLCCPLAEIVPDHPQVCTLIETLLGEVLDMPVRECCDKGVPPSCCFEVVGAP